MRKSRPFHGLIFLTVEDIPRTSSQCDNEYDEAISVKLSAYLLRSPGFYWVQSSAVVPLSHQYSLPKIQLERNGELDRPSRLNSGYFMQHTSVWEIGQRFVCGLRPIVHKNSLPTVFAYFLWRAILCRPVLNVADLQIPRPVLRVY